MPRNACRRLVALLGICALIAPGLGVNGFAANSADPGNALETRQFHMDNARLPGLVSDHQSVTAWQVTQGTWNGQTLDGLSIVFVLSTPEGGTSAEQTNCYISEEATPAQREALMNAFFTTQPQLLVSRGNLRIEPAVISLDVEGSAVVLHLGLIA